MRKFYALSIGILLITVCKDARAGGGVEGLPIHAFYQQTVTGSVLDDDSNPLPGVNVLVKGSTAGTVTDGDGKFSLSGLPDDAVLLFSFIGYATQEVAVNGRSSVSVVLQPDVQALTEIVVTALGIKKESRKLGYSAENVGVTQLQQNRTVNVMESMQGKVAGLDISPPAAGSGASTKIRLRGQSAFSGATNSPLIIINGLPMDQGAQSADGNTARDRGDGLQSINPDDIESITVLKGATAAALYGSRAANGAVVVTTKSGKRGQGIGLEYTTNYTVNTVLDFTDLQQEYGSGTWNQAQLRGLRPTTQGEATTQGQLGWGDKLDGQETINFDGVSRPYVANPNRVKEFYRDGSVFTNTIALSGGNDKGGFRASFSNLKARGITPNNEYSKKIVNMGLNYGLSEKLKFSLNANYAREENDNPPQVGIQGSGEANFIYRVATSIPLFAFRENPVADNGITERQTSGFQTTLINPYFSMPRMFYRDSKNRLLSTATLRYDFTKWLYLQGRYNYDYSTIHTEFNTPTGQGNNSPLNGSATNPGYNGAFEVNETRGTEINADFLLGANKEFGDFSIDVTAGGNTYRTNYGYNVQSVTDFVTLGIYSLGNGLTPNQNTYRIDRRRVNSLYAMAEFGYKGMIYVNVTDRQDWFSVLDPRSNHQNYPSVSGSLIFSEVLQGQKWLSYGKLRGSWAQVGSANGINFVEGNLNYVVPTTNFPNGTSNGQKLGNIENVNAPNGALKPFLVTEKEAGLDLKLFNNRVNLDVAVYEKLTKDQILLVAISNASGYTGTKQNLGSLENRGLELSLEVVPMQTGNFRWTSSFNAANNKTKVLALTPGTTRFTQTTFSGNEFIGQLVYEVGLPINQLSAKTYQRDADGNILLDNIGRLLASDKFVNFGSGLPTWTGGWNNTFTYRNISLLVQFDFKAGGKILSSSNLNWLRQGLSKPSLVGREGGITAEVFPGVVKSTGEPYNGTPVNPQSFYTDYRTLQIADPFIYDNDFIKLRNITLSYDLTSLMQSRTKFIKGLTLSAACRNVWLIYKDLDNLDPEAFASSGDNRVGYEGITMPTTRNYSVNLNVRF